MDAPKGIGGGQAPPGPPLPRPMVLSTTCPLRQSTIQCHCQLLNKRLSTCCMR